MLLKKIAFKAIHLMLSLLLQKPKKISTLKDHIKAIQRRFDWWKREKHWETYCWSYSMQGHLNHINRPKGMEILSKETELSESFVTMVEEGNVNRALKLLTKNMFNGILPLGDNTLQLFYEKHPASKNANDEVLISGENLYIQEYMRVMWNVKRAALKTREGLGPSVLDAMDGRGFGFQQLWHSVHWFTVCRLIHWTKN